eukprot:COSAG05_NODE_977_length_6332_cov_10.027755_7_plen_129_part_00
MCGAETGGGKDLLRPTIWEWIFSLNAIGERVRRREAHVLNLAVLDAEKALGAALARQEHAAATKIQDAMMLNWQKKKKGIAAQQGQSIAIETLGPSQVRKTPSTNTKPTEDTANTLHMLIRALHGLSH